MSDPGRRRKRRSQLLLAATIIVAGAATSSLGFRLLASKEEHLARAQLETDAEQRVRAIERRFRTSVTAIYAVSRFIRNSQPGTRQEFRELSRQRLEASEDILIFGWMPRVEVSRRSDHERNAREQGYADYKIMHPDRAGGFAPAEAPLADDFFPLLHAEPQEHGKRIFGLELASFPACRRAMDRSVELGQPAVTEPIPWMNDGSETNVFFVFRPIFADSAPSDTAQTRRTKLIGFTAVVIRADSMIENALATFPGGVDVLLFDELGVEGGKIVCFYDSEARRAEFAAAGTLHDRHLEGRTDAAGLDVPGRTWSIECLPTPAYLSSRRSPLPHTTLLFGLLLTVVVAAYSNTLMNRRFKVENLVIHRTRELREANESLAYERFLLNTLLDQSPDYIYFKDTESRFIRVSKAVAQYLGFGDPARAIGKTDADVFGEGPAEQYLADERKIMATGETIMDKEEEQAWSDGSKTWVSTNKVPLRNSEGQVVGTFGISRNVTARKQMETQLEAARDAAEAANRAKSEFMANISHEIRTPMNAIMGLTELVLDTDLDDSQREYLKMAMESSESLLSLINDILDFSRIEAGKLEVENAPFGLRELLGDTMRSLAFKAHGKSLELSCHIHSDVPDQLIGDGVRLRQVVVNLVGNAVKFTDAGEVSLVVEHRPESGDGVALEFTVTDTGIGIPEDKKDAVFAAFVQADSSTTRRFGGSGLGLTICSELVALMGGEISLESEIGRGSSFRFTVCLEPALVEDVQTPSVDLAGSRVLVVDDNATSRRILDEVLSGWGMKPVDADGAEEALIQMRKAGERGEPFDLILADANMPEVDGFALAERIRSDDGPSGRVIMMLTSGDRPGDIARCGELGVAAYLLKPVKQSELFNAILAALGIGTTGDDTAAEEPSAEVSRQPLRILLAEDSVVNQKLAVGLLEKRGHTVVVANHGREAVAALEAEDVDLVLMDVQMPEMDGFEATKVIRDREKATGKHVPIIAMTAHAMKGDRDRCLKAGMDDYVAKPIRAKRLLDAIAAAFNSGETEDDGSEPPTADSVGVNWSEAIRCVGGDRELLVDVVKTVLEEAPDLVAAVRDAAARQAADELRAAAHRLKGSIRYFGLTEAFNYAEQLEEMGDHGRVEEAALVVDAMQKEVERLTAILTEYLRKGNASDDS